MWAVGATVGTLGVGGEASYLLYNNIVLRTNISYIALDFNDIASKFGSPKIPINISSEALFVGAIIDFHPFKTGWRISGGARYVDEIFQGNSNEIETVHLGDHDYTMDQIGSLNASIGNKNTLAPYLGFGFDSSHFSQDGSGFRIGLDLGAFYTGTPDVKITTANAIDGLQADLEKEEASIESALQNYCAFYPVLMLSGRINF